MTASSIYDPENPWATPEHERLYVVRCEVEGQPAWNHTVPVGIEWARRYLTDMKPDHRIKRYIAKITYEKIE